MDQHDNLGSFIRENKDILKEYAETRLEIYRLKSVRTISKSTGYLAWIILSLFLLFLVLIFGGIVLSFWLSGIFGSFVLGFGITTLLILIVFVLFAIFRNSLFINPIIKSIISRSAQPDEDATEL